MELKPGYKLTDVGVIPEDWDSPQLHAILKSMQLGGNYKNSERETNWPLIKMGNLDRGSIKLERLKFIDNVQRPDRRDRLRSDDILFNTRNTLELVGKVAAWRDELPEAYFNSNILRMEFEETKVSSKRFMNCILNTNQSLKCLRGLAIGTTSVAAIYSRDLVKLRVPLPTKAEQIAIAEVLSDAEVFIKSLEQLLAKKHCLKQGAMQELLTGRKRLPGFSGKWAEKTFVELFRFSGGLAASRDQLSTEGHCYLHYGDIHTSKKAFIDLPTEYPGIPKLDVALGKVSASALLNDGDVVFVDASEDDEGTSKHVVVMNEEGRPFIAGLHTIVAKSRTDELVHDFRRYCFQTAAVKVQFRFFTVGTKVSGVSKTNIKKITLRFPTVAEQAAIASVLSDMDAEIAALESKIAKARQIKQGMMQELLTGRIRLVPPATSVERDAAPEFARPISKALP